LIDSTKKKVDALQGFIQKLKINNATAIWERSEDLARNKGHFEQYDLVVARSVAYLPKLIEITAHLARKGGIFAFYKLDTPSELADGVHIAKDFGLKFTKAHAYNLRSSPQSRAIYIFQKEI
jgi:16S rRNA G527 N7-methylase RsmG